MMQAASTKQRLARSGKFQWLLRMLKSNLESYSNGHDEMT